MYVNTELEHSATLISFIFFYIVYWLHFLLEYHPAHVSYNWWSANKCMQSVQITAVMAD